MAKLDTEALCVEINRVWEEDHNGSYPGHDIMIALIAKAERERIAERLESYLMEADGAPVSYVNLELLQDLVRRGE